MTVLNLPLRTGFAAVAISLFMGFGPAGCATVKVEAPDKPIEINLNVNIQQEVRVKLERDITEVIDANPDIF